MEELGFPTLPQLHISADKFSDLPEQEHIQALQQWLEQWSTENGIAESSTAVVVKPAVASSAAGLQLADGLEGAMHAVAELLDGVGFIFSMARDVIQRFDSNQHLVLKNETCLLEHDLKSCDHRGSLSFLRLQDCGRFMSSNIRLEGCTGLEAATGFCLAMCLMCREQAKLLLSPCSVTEWSLVHSFLAARGDLLPACH